MDTGECRGNDDETTQGQTIIATDSNDELLEIKTGLSKDSILRYNREYLLKFQYDKDVSRTPITLPAIPDLFPYQRRNKLKKCTFIRKTGIESVYYKTMDRQRIKTFYQVPPYKDIYVVLEIQQNIYKHYEGRSLDYKNSELNMETEDRDTCQLMALPIATVNESMPSPVTFEYDDKCFIVVDFEGANDETNEESSAKNETLGELKEKPSPDVDDINLSRYEKGERHENNDKQYRPNGRGRKRHTASNDWKEEHERYEKRRRRSPHRENERKTIYAGGRGKFTGNKDKNCARKQNINCFSNRRSADKSTEYRRPVILHDAHKEMSFGNSYISNGKHNEQTRRNCNESDQTHPILYENGICIQDEVSTATIDNHEQQLSPVSERSLSPYTDFTGIVRNDEKETRIFESKVNCLEGGKGLENKDEETDRVRAVNNFHDNKVRQNLTTNSANVFKDTPTYIGNLYEFGNFHQTYNWTPSQTQHFYQYRNHHTFPAQYAQYMPQVVPNLSHPISSNNYNFVQCRRQQHRNNIVVKESAPTKNDINEHYWLSSDTLDSLPIAVRNKIVISLYRAMVKAEGLEFTPSEVIAMMKQSRPVNVEFESEHTLFDFLERNKDRFLFQKCKLMISPKTNIKLCPKFTNDPHSKHICMDLHICKYYLFESCTIENCKFSHQLSSKHNEKVLKCHSLWGIIERNIKKLIQNLNNRNISTTPLICKFYNNEGGCQKGEFCMHLHLCTHFISDDCEFQKCKRSHDLNNHQVRNVLEKHGIFPNDSNYDQIRNLIKATLADGKVKLKRELSNYPKETLGTNTKRLRINHCSTVPKIPLKSGNGENTDSSNSKETKSKRETVVEVESNGPTLIDTKPNKQNNGTMQSNNCEHELNKLPDFIPFSYSEKEEISGNNKSATIKPLKEAGIGQTENGNQEEEHLTKTNFSIKETGLTDKIEMKTKSLGKTLLPRWKSMHYRKEDSTNVDNENIIDKTSFTKTEHDRDAEGRDNLETSSLKTLVESTEKTTIGNIDIIHEIEKTKEINILQQLDIKSAGSSIKPDEGEQCLPEVDNVLDSNDQSGNKPKSSYKTQEESRETTTTCNIDIAHENDNAKEINMQQFDIKCARPAIKADEGEQCFSEVDNVLHSNDQIKTEPTSSYKTQEESTEINTTSNFDIIPENENAKEINYLHQVDINPARPTSRVGDEEKQCLPEVDNVLQRNDQSKNKLTPDVTFEITCTGYCVRRNGETWQFRVKSTVETENEVKDIPTEDAWENIPDDKTDELKNIYKIFKEVIGKM